MHVCIYRPLGTSIYAFISLSMTGLQRDRLLSYTESRDRPPNLAIRDEQGDSTRDKQGDSTRDEQGDSTRDEQKGDSTRDEQGDSTRDEQGDSTRDEQGDSTRDEQGDSTRDEQGDSTREEQGDSTRDEQGDSTRDEQANPTKKQDGKEGPQPLVSLSPSSRVLIKPIKMDRGEKCAAAPCRIHHFRGKNVQWVLCEQCNSWLYTFCEHVTTKELKLIRKYICHNCKC